MEIQPLRHENTKKVSDVRCQVSAQLPAKTTADLAKKETSMEPEKSLKRLWEGKSLPRTIKPSLKVASNIMKFHHISFQASGSGSADT
jgi:hypothetical protein